MVIAIAGASASGKSTVTQLFQNELPEFTVVFTFDDYYRKLDHLSPYERSKTNFDNPESIEWPLVRSDFKKLYSGKKIEKPLYDFKNHTRKKETEEIKPAQIILVDGLFTYMDPVLIPYYSIKIAFKSDLDTCLIRRARRDIAERGRDYESVFTQYLTQVAPMFRDVIWPRTKKEATFLIQSRHFTSDIDMKNYYAEISRPFLAMAREFLRENNYI
jgi:uridine kinase